ncbi:MAG: sulfur carrier protein ThiS [Candidatus Gastranaerophilales bacterium]|nr:sulfur carrier protein ThiS [Candidatus Gastranaerophilales bacterium]
MIIKINGKEENIEESVNTLEKLIKSMNDKIPKLFAIEKNGKIIYKENYETETINNNDEIEIVMFCGGG